MAKNKKSRFRGKVSRNVEKQEQAQSSYGYLNLPKGVSLFKVEGDTRVKLDIIPYWVTDEKHFDRDEESEIAMPETLWYKKPFKIHRNIGAGNDSVVCPATFGKKCPICEYRAKLLKEGADKDETDAIRQSLRNLYIVVPVGHKEFDEEPHLWDMSQFLFQNLLNKEVEEDADYEVFPDLEEGLTLKIRFDEQKLGKNKFAEASRIDFIERDEAYEESILDDIPNLDDLLKTHTYKELEAMFFEFEDPDEDVDDDEKPKKETRKFRDVDDDDEDEKPKRKAKSNKKKKKDEEDEDEKPKRSKPNRNKKKEKKDECPEGYEFGKDCEQYDECDDCEVYDACREAKKNS